MKKRIIFLLILNMAIILVSLGIISHLSVNASIQRSLENRLALANIIGKYVDYILENNLKRLYDVSLSGKIDFTDKDWEPEKKALKAAIEYSIFTGRIFLTDLHGNVVIAYPHQEGEDVNLSGIPEVSRTLRGLKPVISAVHTVESTNRKIILALVPLKDKNGDVVGVAGGEIDPTNYLLSQIIRTIPIGADSYIELVDSRGVIIASNDPRRILTCSERYKFLGNLINERKASTLSCHRCKETPPGAKAGKDMLAFAPLSTAPWGIIVRDPQDTVFLPSISLRKGFLVLSVIAIITASLLAIGLSRSIVRPVRSLIDATQRIARGNLEDPIEATAGDEIGTLSRSFDEMRIKLAESHESIQKYSSDLESRVADRTKELNRSRGKLAVLLREIITAGEDERKRIARELHDDTSQCVNAILISLDSVIMRFPADDPRRKHLQQIREQCMSMLKGLHRMIKDLRPPILDDLGLESAIKWVLEKHVGEKGIHFELNTMGNYDEMKAKVQGALDNSKIELVLFRVAQEAIINICKHADAKNVSVSVTFWETGIGMEIQDDGKGFDAAQVLEPVRDENQWGFGLLGMEERIALLDGKLTIHSEPGWGTLIKVYIPIRPEPAPDGSEGNG
ncbi:MAG: HAMP domain-containing protein [Deltaproteobacteria bacterium]|nr:HAMP domain-containing protein [Deltaproteobacteria bacterium]